MSWVVWGLGINEVRSNIQKKGYRKYPHQHLKNQFISIMLIIIGKLWPTIFSVAPVALLYLLEYMLPKCTAYGLHQKFIICLTDIKKFSLG